MASIKIYLAGPEVFLPDPFACATKLKSLCRKHGVVGLFPLDADVVGERDEAHASAIRTANMDLIASCDGIVANMSPFRGPSMDVGTAYEMGVGAALGKIVVGYTNDTRDYCTRVIGYGSARPHRDGGWRDGDGMAIEDFGLADNLMMACGTAAILTSVEAAIAYAARKLMQKEESASAA